LAFLAVYAVQSRAEESRGHSSNSSSLSLIFNSNALSNDGFSVLSRPVVDFGPFAVLPQPLTQYNEKATKDFSINFRMLAAYQQLHDKTTAFAKWWDELNIAKLLADGVDPNAFSELLFIAIEADHAEALASLIDHGADASVLNSSQVSSINHAFNLHRLNAARVFNDKKLIRWDEKDARKMRPLDYALVTSTSPAAFIKALHQEGMIDFHNEFRYRKTVRDLVLDHDDPELFELAVLLPGKTPVKAEAYQTVLYEALMHQISQNDWNIVNFVSNADSSKWVAPFDINTQRANHNGKTLLMAAMQAKALAVVKSLIKRSDINLLLTDRDGQNSLHHAALNGIYNEIEELLVRHAFIGFYKQDTFQRFPTDYISNINTVRVPSYLHLEDYLPEEQALQAPVGAIKDAATRKLQDLFEKFMHGRANISPEDFQGFINNEETNPLTVMANLNEVKIENPSKPYGYTWFLEILAVFLDDQAFLNHLHGDVVDWSAVDLAALRNWLLMSNDLNKIEAIYLHYINKGLGNIFDVGDIKNARPIDFVLVQDGTKAPAASIGFIGELEALGVTHLAKDVIENPFTRRHLARSDNFELVNRFLPEPAHPEYQSIVYDMAMYAVQHQRWNVVNGLLDLPEFDINTQRGEYEGKTLFMAAMEIKAFDIVDRLADRPEFNPYSRNKNGLNAFHCIAKYYPDGKMGELVKKIVHRDQYWFYIKNYSGKMSYEYALTGKQKEELDVQAEKTRPLIAYVHRTILEKYIYLLATHGTKLEDAKYKESFQNHFNNLWSINDMGVPRLLGMVDPLEKYNGFNLMDFTSQYASDEQFKELMHFDSIPWHKPGYAYYREVVFNRPNGFILVEMLYKWGMEHGHGNIFDLPNEQGLKPLHVIFNALISNPPMNLKKLYKLGYERYEKAGIINFERDFGISSDELFAKDYASFQKIISDKVHELLKVKADSEQLVDFMLNAMREQPLKFFAVLLAGILSGYFLTKDNPPPQAPVIETAPQARRQRNTPPRQVRALELTEQAVVAQDPRLSQARAEQASLQGEHSDAEYNLRQIEPKKDAAKLKASSIDPALADLLANLVNAYEASYLAYKSHVDSLNAALYSIESFIAEPDNVELLADKEAKVKLASEAKPKAESLNKACHDALNAFIRAENALEQKRQTEELVASKKAREIKTTESIEKISDKFEHWYSKTDMPVLVKYKKLQEQLVKARTKLEISEKTSAVLNSLEAKLREFKQGEVETRLNSLQVHFARAKNKAYSISDGIKEINTLRSKMEQIGIYEPEVAETRRKAKQILMMLKTVKRRKEKLIQDAIQKIQDLETDIDLTAISRYEKAQKEFASLKKAAAELGMLEIEIKPFEDIIKGLESEAKAVMSAPVALPTIGRARLEATVRASMGAAGGAGESKVPELREVPQSHKDAIQYTCQLLHYQLNQKADKCSEGDAAYVDRYRFLALIYNFARLLELLKDRPIAVAGARDLRNQLFHRYYQAQERKEDLLKLIEIFSDDVWVLAEISKGSLSLSAAILESNYYKAFCGKGEDYRRDLRDYGQAKQGLLEAVSELKSFTDKLDWSHEHKGPELQADALSLQRDSAKMQLVIIGELLKGPHKTKLSQFLKERHCAIAKLLATEEDAIGNIHALRDLKLQVVDARNLEAHEGTKNVSRFGGRYVLTPAISIDDMRKTANQLGAILLPVIEARGGAGGSAGAAGGMAQPKLVIGGSPASDKRLSPHAEEFHPGQ
jgi:hypothetical protein